MTVPRHRHHLHGGALGAVIGAVIGIVAVLIVDRLAAGAQNNLLWLPAGIAVGIIGGGVVGLLVAEELLGGRDDRQATEEGRRAVEAEQRRIRRPR